MIRRWWSAGATILLGLAGCGRTTEPPASEAQAAVEPSVVVRIEPARLGSVTSTADGLGRCEALPDQIATLTPAVEGHVEALLVKQGEAVKKGQPIVELDKAVATADLAEKTATRDGLKASLVLLKSLPRPEEQKPLELAIDQARVAVERARAIADRLRPLHDKREISDQQFFDANKAVESAILLERAASAAHHVHMIGPRPEAIAESEARIKTADGLVAFSKAHLDFHTIRSPIDGVLESLTCHPGQTISIGTPIGDVVDSRLVYAAVWLPPRSAQGVRPGKSAQVRLADDRPQSAEDPASEDVLVGKVDFVGRVADPQTGNLPVRVLVDNAAGRLAVGQTLQVSIALEERAGVLQVPAAAVYDQGEGPVVGVVRDGKAVMLRPQVGSLHDGWVAISGVDLKEGEPVIVEGAYSLPDGTPVKVAPGVKAVARAEVLR